MKEKNLILLVAIMLVAVTKTSAQNTWMQKANLTGIQRAAHVAFTIDTVAYVGLGYNFSQAPAQQTDLWKYSPATDTWTQMASFPTGGVSGASAFSIGSKGYVAGGFSSTTSAVDNELWEYSAVLNTWAQKTSCPCAARDYAVAFSINGRGYFGTGYDASSANFSDFWSYLPATDSWVQRADLPGFPRSSAVGFSIGGKGYIGSGYIAGGVYDFWQYNPATNSWLQKADIGTQGINDACGFAIGGYGYICSGYFGSVVSGELFEYDTLANTWTPMLTLTGPARSNSAGFAVGSKGYVTCGNDVSFSPLNDLWEYTPNSILTSVPGTRDENVSDDRIEIYPNPVINQLAIGNRQLAIEDVEVYNSVGEKFFTQQLTANSQQLITINVSKWKSGIYFVRIKTSGRNFDGKFVKE
jgi:N-acetylneuraminic acid mutarotase